MTRILYWNVENFSKNKINNFKTVEEFIMSCERFDYIFDIFMQTKPDIFVIIEIQARTTELSLEGLVIPQDRPAVDALISLLENFRAYHNENWALVPPICNGTEGFREAVAVFYNAKKLQFIGPYLYCTDKEYDVPRAVDPDSESVKVLDNYPNEFNDWLPDVRFYKITIEDEEYEIPENQFAQQWCCFDGNYNRIGFPNWSQFNQSINRSPIFTKFIDLEDENQRIINLFSVHTSPGSAIKAVRNLALPQEIENVRDTEVNVIVGDFNIDTFDTRKNNAYSNLVSNYYLTHLIPYDQNEKINNNRKPYCMTHLLPWSLATPFNAKTMGPDSQHNVYPRLGYMGSCIRKKLSNSGAIDDIFTRYGNDVEPPDNHNISIVNTITGKPYNSADPTPDGVTDELTGGLSYTSSLQNELPLPDGIAASNDSALIQFREWANFGKIRSTSDHLAISIDI